ncbi:sensor domain-containing diguanylate cyclase [Vibrio aerogenes]|uniref:sensor domain-containing diguanylate cyclase n=3 Tax=Vibrio aerogenes TaxID=92172 RepID=UPI0021C2FBAD|nr:sensor domain-containing diguanylate cyclase [Vibrio aerogenes]
MVKKYKFNRWIFILLSIIYGFFAYTTINLLTERFVDKQIQQAKESIQHELALVRYSIEAYIYRDAYLADSFATVVALNPQFAMKNWKQVSEPFVSKATLVRNIGLAPDDVISYVYPLKGNEKAVGLDFRTVPAQYKTVQMARETKQVVIAGPLELVQGGRGLIARYPIFTDLPYNNNYWGGLSVVINYDRLIETSGLHQLQGVEVAIVADTHDGMGERVIEGDASVLTQFDMSYPIYLPNDAWTLFARYQNLSDIESISRFRHVFVSLGIVTFVAGYILMMFFISNYLRAHNLSLHDELTQLPNRRYLFSELNLLMARKGAWVEFTVLNIDLNKFKEINDSLGHEAGDQVLKHMALSLQKCLRTTDFISRVGGDEFIIVLRRTSKKEDVELIIRKIHLFLESRPLHWNNDKIWLSLSIGFHIFKGKADPKLIQEILSIADKKMYEDKTLKHTEL